MPLSFIVQLKPRAGLVLCCISVVAMFILLTVASCTSNGGFEALYKQVSQALFLNGSSWSLWVKAHPGFGHVVSYALLSFILSLTLSGQRLFIAPLLACFFGLLMECVQVFIPTRGASGLDLVSNTLGVAIGFCIYMLWMAYVRQRGATTLVAQAASAEL